MAIKLRNYFLLSFSCLILLVGPSFTGMERSEILQGQMLKDGEELFSVYGNFKLGFFSPDGSTNRYLGIWYHRPRDPRVDMYYYINFGSRQDEDSIHPVWVANRNTPILDKSGRLTINSFDGNLKILHNGGDPIAVSSIHRASNTCATLLKSGNFVLYEVNSNGTRRELWQSFDYPTDTLLPGMKLGMNLQTGHVWFLQSWISKKSPSQGSFTLSMDRNASNQLIISYRGGEVNWIGGIWLNGHFTNHTLWDTSYYEFKYTTTEQEKYFSYDVAENYTSFPKLKINPNGLITNHNGFAITLCSDYWMHGACLPGKIASCRSKFDFMNFQAKSGFMSGDGFKFKESDKMSLVDCQMKCFYNCSCVAFAVIDEENDTGCEIWGRGTKFIDSINNGRIINIQIEPKKNRWLIWLTITIAIFCIMSYTTRRKYKAIEEKWWMSLIIALATALVLPLLCYLCYLQWKKLKAKVEHNRNRRQLLLELGDNVSLLTTYGDGRIQEEEQTMKHEMKIFDFQTIVAATNNFSTANKLGEGGFGPVYKGQLLDGQEIAVKRLSRRSGQGIMEFKNEAKLIARLQHTNLVRLLGCSLHGEERILVYEYMQNKSLDLFIFNSERQNKLNWKTRFNIVEGVAQGLIYLHKYSRLRVIHRDLKAGNILLDNQMNPKISDFGMARIFRVNESEANTKRVVGTYGYMAPEYAMNGIVSMKTDVFSFGVLVLEIVSGKKSNSCYDAERPINLAGYAWQLWNEGKGLDLVDAELEDGSSSPSEVLRCIHVGLLCVQNQATDRPTMSDVVSMLTNESVHLPIPKQPAFFINPTTEEPGVTENKSVYYSNNNVTMTVMEAR